MTMGAGSRQRGFTLIELLVTIVIVGIVLSIVTLSLNLAGDDREIRREVQRLMSILEVAQDDAMLQGREFGIEFLLGAYRFVEYDSLSGLWLEIPGEDVLRMRALPEGMELSLRLEDKLITLEENPIALAANGDEDNDDRTLQAKNYAPHVLIFSSGEMTPFELRIRRLTDQLSVALQSDLLGNLEFVDDESTQY
jgi:general secretion pathway protein H